MRLRCTIFVNIIDFVVCAVVNKLTAVLLSSVLKNPRNLSSETLHFYLYMYQNAFGGRAPPGPDGGADSAPGPLAGLTRKEGRGVGKGPRGKGRVVQSKVRHRNHPRDKNKEVRGTKFKFGQLIFGQIIKIVAPICHILRLKCTKFDFGWGSAQTPLGELTALLQTP